jgi:hypothetical protein
MRRVRQRLPAGVDHGLAGPGMPPISEKVIFAKPPPHIDQNIHSLFQDVGDDGDLAMLR